ncbi:MAG: hypothetical protein JWM80_4110 [Cyanobacteria bacterium RYN_339]|nr:hypothetical protein [Cyanobacteria bacterium RYN_339]
MQQNRALIPLFALTVALASCRAPLAPKAAAGSPGASALQRAASLEGTVIAPAGIVAQGGGNIVAQGGGNIVAQGGGNIVAQGGGNYRLRAVIEQKPLAGARVQVLDAADAPLKGPDGKPLATTTDAAGHYAFDQALPPTGVRVVVELGPLGRFEAIAPNGRTSSRANVDLASTLTSSYILNRFVRPQADPRAALDRLTPDAAVATVEKATRALEAARVQPPTRFDQAHVDVAVDLLRQQDRAFDQQLDTVRKLLVVGSATVAVTDGPARQAVVSPFGLAVDAGGTAYFTDKNLVRQLRPDGRVVTLAGSGEYGDADGKGTAATFAGLGAVALDRSGIAYVLDFGNAKVRKVAPDGMVFTFAPGTAFDLMAGIAVDAQGNVYVSELRPQRIRKFAPDGTAQAFAGSGQEGQADGPGAAATFTQPGAMAFDAAGMLYVLDGFQRLRRVAPDGRVQTVPLSAPIDGAAALAVDAAGGIYVGSPQQVFKVSATGTVTPLAGSTASGAADGRGAAASFGGVNALAVDAHGTLFAADLINHLIRTIGVDGTVATAAGTGAEAADGAGAKALYSNIWALAWAGTQALYVFDAQAHRISQVAPAGSSAVVPGGTGEGGTLDGVLGLAASASGELFLVDANTRRVRKLAAGALVDLAGGGDARGPLADGKGSAARFGRPTGIAIDARGVLYVQDLDPTGRGLIRAIAPDGTVSTLGASGADETPTMPNDVHLAVDAKGVVYISDGAARVVRTLTPGAGAAVLLAGSGQGGGQDGQGAQASFEFPQGIAVDARGNVYVADAGIGAVRKIAPGGAVTSLTLPLPPQTALGSPLAVNATNLTFCSDKQVFSVPLP